jgi:hypothetical protein
MLKRIKSATIFILIWALAASAFQTGEWIKVSPAGAGFSVLMPAKPEEEIKSSDDFTSHLFSITTDKVIYLAGYGEYAPSIKLSADAELTLNRDRFLRGLNANLLASRQITLDGHPGLEFTGESEQASFKSRVYLSGNRVYQVAVAVLSGKTDHENVDRFFASFAFANSESHAKP